MKRSILATLLISACAVLLAPAQDKPVPPGEAPARMTLPEGFRATLFAGEPDVVQPIAFTFDDRGRLWVAECLSYPDWRRDGKPGPDRIVILEDRDGDGRFDTRKVFLDNLANVSGLVLGFGGVWVCATPNLLFIPDRDGDGVPDGPPEVVLDGWSLDAKHNVFNALTWGPDGWLYGGNGILATSHVGKPGTPAAQRVPFNCGVWRYHPTRRTFEVVATGTTNPWGLDFDDRGEMFITNCVIAHLWHVIPGAHFQRMYGQDFNPHWYSLMTSPADHLHWAGGAWQSSRGGEGSHGQAGGGHAHSGAMVYLGDNWPDRYRHSIFMCNLHGNRVNHDRLERRGSGYVAHHDKDFLFANDPWFRGLSVQYGPDGGVFVSDWCDTGECHDYDDVHRTSGRIYKVTYGKVHAAPLDLAKLSDAELVQRQLHKNDWHVRHARRLLQERAAAGKLEAGTPDALRRLLREHPDVTRKLRALWALYAVGGVDEALLSELLDSPHETVRVWAVRLGAEDRRPSEALRGKWAKLAASDPAACVRLALASALQRLPLEQRWPIAEALVAHAEDADDANLPLMLWYAIESLVPADRQGALRLLSGARIPLLREYLARRLVHLDPEGLRLAIGWLGTAESATAQRAVLRGIQEALTGQRQVPPPADWGAVAMRLTASSGPEVRERVLGLGAVFGDPQALASLRRIALDKNAGAAARHTALQALLQRKAPDLVPVLLDLLRDAALRGAALRGLAEFSDGATPPAILNLYPSLTEEEKADAVQTLAARPEYALALLDAVEKGRVPRRDLSAFTVRQMLSLKNARLTERLNRVWGALRPASQEKAGQMAKYKALLTPAYLQTADVAHGRAVFARTCAACHRLFDDGGAIGPDLTGSQRGNLDYVLENLLDPNAIVYDEYRVTVVETKDGRVVGGLVKQETDKALTLQTQNESVVLPKDEIASRTKSSISLMPEGLLANLKADDVRDLVAYLASPRQVPLPPRR
jgi:putative membrane-bound dehydrogenase-like protein